MPSCWFWHPDRTTTTWKFLVSLHALPLCSAFLSLFLCVCPFFYKMSSIYLSTSFHLYILRQKVYSPFNFRWGISLSITTKRYTLAWHPYLAFWMNSYERRNCNLKKKCFKPLRNSFFEIHCKIKTRDNYKRTAFRPLWDQVAIYNNRNQFIPCFINGKRTQISFRL